MTKNEPIIFTICNFGTEPRDFRFSKFEKLKSLKKKMRVNLETYYQNNSSEFLRKEILSASVSAEDIKEEGFCADIKVNTTWYNNVILNDFELDLAAGQYLTILVKPHNDKYFAGWGRWFNFYSLGGWRFNGIRNLLVAVLSDPDYAHLESETKIGENFRSSQFYNCQNLKIVPSEDVWDGDFEEIGNCFRQEQYWGCNSLKIRPKEAIPEGIKKIGTDFRLGQYWRIDDYLDLQNGSKEYWQAVLRRNDRLFINVPDELKTKEMCEIAIKANFCLLKYVPDTLKTEEICKMALDISIFALKFVPEKFKTEEICKMAVEKEGGTLEFVPGKMRTNELFEIAVKNNGLALELVPESMRTKEICEIAVKNNERALKYVPQELKNVA